MLGVEPDARMAEFARRRGTDGIREAGGFGDTERWRFDGEQSYSREAWLDLLPTTGGLTRLPPGSLAHVLDAVGAAIDAIGGAFALLHHTRRHRGEDRRPLNRNTITTARRVALDAAALVCWAGSEERRAGADALRIGHG